MSDAEKIRAAVFARTASGETLYARDAVLNVPRERPADARTDEIRARAAAATPGHWGTGYDGQGTYTIEAQPRFVPGSGAASVNDGVVARLAGQPGDEQTYSNADFIASARDDVPYLLDRVAELEKQLREQPHELAEAQVHATLALAASNVHSYVPITEADREGWAAAVSNPGQGGAE